MGRACNITIILNYKHFLILLKVIAFIGGVIPEKIKEEICGIVMSIRKEQSYLQVWIRNSKDTDLIKEIEYFLFH